MGENRGERAKQRSVRDSESMNRDRGHGSHAIFDRDAVPCVQRRYCNLISNNLISEMILF